MDATEYIHKLGLVPHPEGGYYRQLFGNDETGEKPVSTIYYMLTANDMSAFHRLHNMVEIWYFHAGEPLNIYVIEPDGSIGFPNKTKCSWSSNRSSGLPPRFPPNAASASSDAPSAQLSDSRTSS